MAGYVKGSKALYNFLRGRLLAISCKLRSPELTQEERDALYSEQCRIIFELEDADFYSKSM